MLEAVFAVYVLLCGIWFGIRYRSERREGWLRFILAAGLPVIGQLLPVFWPRRAFGQATAEQAAAYEWIDQIVEYEMQPAGIYRMPEREKEMNVVPLEEALLVNDLSTRRRVMIDLLKQDSLDNLEVLQLAVRNDDTETSHYAVSAIMEIKRKLTIALQELAVKYEENPNDPYLLRSYAEVLERYMRSGFLDERTLLKHKYTYSRLLGRLLELAPDSADEYGAKIKVDLELGEYQAAELTAKQYLELFPLREDAYLCLMNVYFSARSLDKLQETLEALKKSPIRLSNQALTIVRFWSGRMK